MEPVHAARPGRARGPLPPGEGESPACGQPPYACPASYGKTHFARSTAVPSTADRLDGPAPAGEQDEIARGSPAG